MLDFAMESLQRERQLKTTQDYGRELKRLIAVTAPYFALNNIDVTHHGFIKAEIPIELLNHNEIEGICLSEAGRHMAILGSLALAHQNKLKEKHYYLATDAVFERLHNRPVTNGKCQGIVQVDSMSKKDGAVLGQLWCNDEILYEVSVRFVILHERIFQRLFNSHHDDSDIFMLGNPYAHQTRFFVEYISTKSCLASIGRVRKEDCVGHFEGFPALPVARIGGAMVDLSGFHYNAIRDSNENFCVKRAELHAENFIFAGDSVTIETLSDTKGADLVIDSVAHSSAHQNAVAMKCTFF